MKCPGNTQVTVFACHFCCHLEAASQCGERRSQEIGPPFLLCRERHSSKSCRWNKVSGTEARGEFGSEGFRLLWRGRWWWQQRQSKEQQEKGGVNKAKVWTEERFGCGSGGK